MKRYFLPLNKFFDLYIKSGGYPISINGVITNALHLSSAYEEIYNYIKNDAATITSSLSGNPLKAGLVLSGVLDFVGGKVSYSKIAQKMSMNKSTLVNYSNRLENSFVFLDIKGMKSFKNKLKDSEVKKFYFSDVFMHYSAGATKYGKTGDVYSAELINSTNIGTIVKEIIAGHLIRLKEKDPMLLYGTYLKFYDDNKEIDFIYRKEDEQYIGIEVKYQNSTPTRDIKRVSEIQNYILLTKSSEVKIKNNIAIFPVCLFLALLQDSKNNL